MFKPNKILAIALIALMSVAITSCIDDLNTSPLDKDVVTSESVYETPNDYKKVLAKLYAGFATTGQQGPAGNRDIQGIDEGFSSYVRQLWVHQELPTDEAVVAWDDPGLPQFNTQEWTPSNDFVMGLYSRIYYEISLANEFIRNAKGSDNSEIQAYMAEARFIRALSYWHALDFYGEGVPFVTEEDGVGAYLPEPATAKELFAYIEGELKAIESELPAPQSNEYARADKAAVWTLLTKLYLNAEVYIGEDHYDDAITYANKVIDQGGYSLESNYGDLFKADNHTANGIIFPIAFDGVNTKTWGGTTFITHAAVGGSMNPGQFGIDGGWYGLRTTPEFVSLFDEGQPQNGYQNSNPDNKPEIYVPGGYQSASGYDTGGNANWDPNDAPRLTAEGPAEDSVFTGYVYFAQDNSEFKFTLDRTWNTPVGLGKGDFEGNLWQDAGSPNLSIEKAGMYKFTVNLKGDLTQDPEGDAGEPVVKRTPVINRDINFKNTRDQFHNHRQAKDIEAVETFTDGYAVSKWKNVTSNNTAGADPTFVDIDFPMFRLADVYLMYAEAVERGGGGSEAKAVNLINDLRERAYGDQSANITSGDLTLDFILDERARELYWEGHRRTDLRRFSKFTGGEYVWSWKGDIKGGSATDQKYNLYPLPASDVNSNPNLSQNPDY
ncbi:RagB/SusD family nutrient uptake outer membrane protein [Fodinibius halophilus]|uniref:RagB/SusD family nutrient uptake outer membrane protein n=1 Tax=Fodinibius halophilus TaxID=1736908 RepID=A0A6M1SZI3_9BACT|nr:RagB/SusD family nutrient uptake outer membrane protein [Fodinibius halophilus]NGP87039.1 RagB/SusD family nutrient uptake outer membrane protein [Fodinibius halophilus]